MDDKWRMTMGNDGQIKQWMEGEMDRYLAARMDEEIDGSVNIWMVESALLSVVLQKFGDIMVTMIFFLHGVHICTIQMPYWSTFIKLEITDNIIASCY